MSSARPQPQTCDQHRHGPHLIVADVEADEMAKYLGKYPAMLFDIVESCGPLPAHLEDLELVPPILAILKM